MSEPQQPPFIAAIQAPQAATNVAVIRPASLSDAPAIADVQVAASRVAYAGVLPLESLTVDDREATWRSILEAVAGDSFTLVAEVDGEVVGFCDVAAPSRDKDATRTTAEIASIYVNPARWRCGVGRLLLGEAFARLSQHSAWREVTLWVLSGNYRARAFYHALGFAPDGAESPHAATGGAESVHAATGQSEIRLRATLSSKPTAGSPS
jgi:ribosomal protein S18 acetylase RimI-like enzyme